MNAGMAVRAMGLYGPAFVALMLWMARRPGPKKMGAAVLLAGLWSLVGLVVLQTVNQRAGWWSFQTEGPVLRGMPVELYLGWVSLWGVVPVLAFRRVWVGLVSMVALDLVAMPLCGPVVVLGRWWLAGEGIAALGVLLPGLLLARWTIEGRHVKARAGMQVAIAAGVFLYLTAEMVFAVRGGGWSLRLWMLEGLVLLAVPGLSAVQEFAVRGGGTPIPYDPPERLVVSGMYRYVANPMQVSCALAMVWWGWCLGSWWLAAGAAISAIYSAGIARWDEGQDLAGRFGEDWRGYRREVRDWAPRMTPYFREPARIYFAQTCGVCTETRMWLERQGPVGLEILAAETHPEKLRRVRYEDGDYKADGIEAMARAFEHIHLGWALLGVVARLPGVRQVTQMVADAVGFGPRDLVYGETCDIGSRTSLTPVGLVREQTKLKQNHGRRPKGWFAALS